MTATQKLMKLKRVLLIIIMINILILKNLISKKKQQKILQQDKNKEIQQAKTILLISQKRFDDFNKLKNVDKKFTSNKTKHIEFNTKLYDLEKKLE